jgi:hypothetical protein
MFFSPNNNKADGHSGMKVPQNNINEANNRFGMKIPRDSTEEAIGHTGKRVSQKISKRIGQQSKRARSTKVYYRRNIEVIRKVKLNDKVVIR